MGLRCKYTAANAYAAPLLIIKKTHLVPLPPKRPVTLRSCISCCLPFLHCFCAVQSKQCLTNDTSGKGSHCASLWALFFLSLFYVFYFSPFSVWGGGKKVSVNRFMCSIHKALYTSSIKQESALYTLAHCAIEGAWKGLVQASLFKKKEEKKALSTTLVESNIE